MIFGDQLLPKVLDGSKRVTRRPVKYERVTTPFNGPARSQQSEGPKPCKYKVGRTAAVQPVIKDGPGKGRGGKAVARIRILDVRRGLVGGVDAEEAQLEGFPSVVHFRRYWCHLYGRDRFPADQLVDRIEFELVSDSRTGS